MRIIQVAFCEIFYPHENSILNDEKLKSNEINLESEKYQKLVENM